MSSVLLTRNSSDPCVLQIRSFAKFVNETPGKRDEFLCLQPPGIRLLPLDDANARWNSVFLMLKRASRLRRFIDQYCQERGNLRYKLTNTDWRKVDYVVQLTMPFIQFTTALLASKEATVHKVCFVFKILMTHIDQSAEILRRKSAPWKRTLLEASLVMKMELGEVYEKTFQDFGVMYGTGTFVAPQYKVSAFDGASSWQGLGHPERYIEYLRIFHLQYRPQMPTSLSCVNGLSCSPQLLGLDRLLHPLAGLAGSSRSGQDEVDQYLREGLNNCSLYFLLTTDTQQGLSISRHALTGKTINTSGLFSLDWLEIYSPFRLQVLAQSDFSPLHKKSAMRVGNI